MNPNSGNVLIPHTHGITEIPGLSVALSTEANTNIKQNDQIRELQRDVKTLAMCIYLLFFLIGAVAVVLVVM